MNNKLTNQVNHSAIIRKIIKQKIQNFNLNNCELTTVKLN